ncbi:hypothetical protein CAPTEDRAFT_212919 [Capitella teleta]|uniref:Uncharacterized protein n=1 Tax=Capitella teleta TaxID=283909 RepID=R7TI34_CAPTE|nr:hypothetical protein CAPTEDRAFT_212919 [Capitella teleta]|eukprot:ELT93374.1 hypothetical protein CAPTEDRAFT_212919 [Capitella teleta]
MAVEVMIRPYSSMGFAPCVDYTNTTAQVGDLTLHPGIKKDLEKFYDRATNAEDRQRCLHLIRSLEGAQPPSANRRPYSAIVLNVVPESSRMQDKYGPYSTTYGRQFGPIPDAPAQQMRPSSTKQVYHAAYDRRAPVSSTTYQNEFYSKGNCKATAIRSGSSSGQRNNNPHPFPSFMTWKLPRKSTQGTSLHVRGPEISSEAIEKVIRNQMSSTYQNDYLGIPQGYQMDEAFGPQDDWKSRIPYTLDSSTRETYQEPHQQPELKNETKRYASNSKKHITASGIVPNASDRYKHIYPKTTYKREFVEPADQMSRARRAQMNHGHMGLYADQALRKQFECSTGEERGSLSRMMGNMRLCTPSLSLGRRSVSPVPPGCLRETTPEWMHGRAVHPEEIFDI